MSPIFAPFPSRETAEQRRLRAEIARTRSEIALATQKLAGIQAAIDSRRKSLARLEAQLVLTESPAGQTTPVIAD